MQYLVHFADHLILHWSLVSILEFIDTEILVTEKWNYYKVNPFVDYDISKAINVVLTNQVFVLLPFLYLFSPNLGDGNIFEFSNIYKFFFAILLVETFFYHIHMFFHHPFLYSNFHSLHHLHRYVSPIFATYSHPIEYLFCNILPVFLSGYIVGFNMITFRIWHMIALFNSIVFAHGGYKFSVSHNKHHINPNYNFGVIGLFDKLYSTD